MEILLAPTYNLSRMETTPNSVVRIGSVPYLNSKVLVHGLQPRTDAYSFESHVPSVLARKLRAGDVDVALVSSIEYFRYPGSSIVPGISISSLQEMWSIHLFHRVPLRSARKIGLDPASETTNALLQIILQEKHQVGVELVALQPGEDPLARSDLDGFLKIGDPCLAFTPPADHQITDLAAEWHAWTNLPFVFAVWVCRPGAELRGVNTELFLAKCAGLRHVDDIARAAAPALGIDFLRAKNYISKIVRYDLGRPELAGMSLFQRYLVRQQLVRDAREFDFYTR